MLEAIAPLALTLTLTALLVAPALAQDPPDPPGFGPPPSLGAGGMGPGGFGPGGGPMQRGDLKVLEQFDADHDGRLSPAERTEARAWLKTNRPRRGGPGGPGGPGGFGGPDGLRFPGRGGERDGERNDAPADRHGVRVLPGEVASFADRALFDPEVVRTIFLQFPQDDWFAELEDFYRTDVDIPADVVVDGQTYRGVGVHMRGNTSYQMVRTRKKSLHLDFDFTVAGQQLYGHSATNLINNNEDPSLLHETIGAWVSNRHAQAPRSNLVRVVVNGEDLGVYSNVEHFDKDFLEAQFGSKKGSRFKVPPDFSGGAALKDLGDDLAAYKRAYEIKSKDDPQAWQRLRTLCGCLGNASDAQLQQQLPQLLDIDGALWFLALDNALLDGDGYYSRGSDYALWLDKDQRFHVIARDGNEVLGSDGPPGGRGRRGPGGQFGGPPLGPDGRRGPPDGARPDGARPDDARPDGARRGGRMGPGGMRGRGPGPGGGMRMPTVDQPALAMADDTARPLIRRLLGIPAWRERYLFFLHTVAVTSLDPAVLAPRIDAWQAAIDPLVRVDAHSLEGHDAFVAALGDAPQSLRSILRTRHQKLLADPALQGPWPAISDVGHAFVGGPGDDPALRVCARGGDGTAAMTLHFGTGNLGPFTAVAMADDGQHGDGAAGDGMFGATTAPLPQGTAVRYFVEATLPSGRAACAPTSGGARPTALTTPGAAKGQKKQERDG